MLGYECLLEIQLFSYLVIQPVHTQLLRSTIQGVLRKMTRGIICSTENPLNLISHYLVGVFVPTGARHYQNVVNYSAVKQHLKGSLFACFMVAKAQARSQNLADSVVPQQRLIMGLKHERNVSTGQKSLTR